MKIKLKLLQKSSAADVSKLHLQLGKHLLFYDFMPFQYNFVTRLTSMVVTIPNQNNTLPGRPNQSKSINSTVSLYINAFCHLAADDLCKHCGKRRN